jgi:hypothetical protein
MASDTFLGIGFVSDGREIGGCAASYFATRVLACCIAAEPVDPPTVDPLEGLSAVAPAPLRAVDDEHPASANANAVHTATNALFTRCPLRSVPGLMPG